MENIIDEWKALALYHTTAASQAEAKIQELSSTEEKSLDIRALVLKMADGDSKSYKAAWKKIIDEGMVRNVMSILDDCYTSLICDDSNEDFFMEARALGAKGSLKWQEFCVRVIQHLKVEGSFGSLKEGFDTFEDTAGGCDEITWDACLYLLDPCVNPE